MKIGLFEKESGQLTVFNCKSDLIRKINISASTLQNWNKKGKIKENEKYLIMFDVDIKKATKNKRKAYF